MIKRILVAVLAVISFAGCKKTDKCNYSECAIKAPDAEIQSVKDYLASQGITNAVQHCSGMFYVIDKAGADKHPDACSYINVTYRGTLTNGVVFDQGTTDLFLDGVITGWRNGIPLVGSGGLIHLYIPPTLGYGSAPNGSIPGNSILVFDVVLNATN
jgi:FKBP-type peptidyl-prolyl cis-trans isomerase FkpA